jgi:hypothetical protein
MIHLHQSQFVTLKDITLASSQSRRVGGNGDQKSDDIREDVTIPQKHQRHVTLVGPLSFFFLFGLVDWIAQDRDYDHQNQYKW